MTAINANRAIRGPITAVPLVAGKGVRLTADVENNRWVVEADETVLYENSTTGTQGSHSISLSESLFNFEHAIFYVADDAGTYGVIIVPTSFNATSGACMIRWTGGYRTLYVTTSNGTDWAINGYQWYGSGGGEIGSGYLSINKVIGINRIASN